MQSRILTFIILFFCINLHAQHCHTKEMGWKGKIKMVTCIYYAEGVWQNNRWTPKDTVKFTYKTESYFNQAQNIDSLHTYVNHGGKQKLVTKKIYSYVTKTEVNGSEYDFMEDISYTLSVQWLDKSTYVEYAKDASGNNRISSKVYLDDKFHIIKKEDQLYREGQLFDHSITETKFNPDNTEHAVSVTENKLSNLEYSQDEYTDQRDSHGNAIKKTFKNGINEYRSIKYYIIEYYD